MFFPLIVLLFGIVEFSRLFSLQLRLQQAAREAAREVALHYDDPTPPDPNAIIDNLVGAGVTRAIDGCTGSDDDTTIVLEDTVDLVVPELGGGQLGAVDVAARARMPCEG